MVAKGWRTALLLSMLLFLTAPIAAWIFYKRVRVIAPEWAADVSCIASTICLDDETRFLEAAKLYEDAFHFVDTAMGPFREHPRVIFCSTSDCFRSFGFESTAGDLGKLGIVIGPRGWSDYYVRHEMIHHRQAEELGFVASIRDPPWFIEGMAYSLSDDPRRPLSEPWQTYRTRFEGWYLRIGKEHLWEEAKKL